MDLGFEKAGFNVAVANEFDPEICPTYRHARAIPGVEFSETRELGRINRVDPLGITYMRVRGMWGIENPWTVFDYVYRRDMRMNLNFMCLINNTKWSRLEDADRLYRIKPTRGLLKIADVKIKDPDNPAKLNGAKLIQFCL